MATNHTPAARAADATAYAELHQSVCRYFAHGLVCSICTAAVERAQRMARLVPRPAIREVRGRFEDLFPSCASGCGELVERQGESCYSCLSRLVGQR